MSAKLKDSIRELQKADCSISSVIGILEGREETKGVLRKLEYLKTYLTDSIEDIKDLIY